MPSRAFISSLLPFLFITLLASAKSTEQPNVLVIMVDDLGYADLSSYGSTDMQTPHLDKLVSEGMRFNEFYANSCVCSPTRAAFLTGRFPESVGMRGVNRLHRDDSWGYLDPEAIMLPSLFQQAGYHTSLIGKWHLGITRENRPNQRGFEEFHGMLLGMMDDYWEHTRQGMEQMRWNEIPIFPEGHGTDLITDWSIASLKRRAQSDQPFFQFLAYNAPHFPVQPPPAWLKRVKEREPDISETRALMVAFVEHLDYAIGQVLKAVDELGLRDNTIVFFTSDNGGLLSVGSNNGDLRSGKTHMYEGGLKVPAFVRWPERIKAGQVTDFRALTMDILPTMAELCGFSIPHQIDGQSFAKLLQSGDQQAFEREVSHIWLEKDKTREYIRVGDWKLLNDQWQPEGDRVGVHYELYNIREDPGEENNLADSMPEKAQELSGKLEAHIVKAQQIEWKRPKEAVVPSYLADYSEQYLEDPRAANLQWFQDAGYGLFLHYGLYALMGKGEWVQLMHKPEPVPVAEYAKLADQFTAENFDADFIVDFVKRAGMKYINITSKHHDGYSLFDTQLSDFKTTNSPCSRDLIAELYAACEREGVGLFLYYSYAADWKHPWFMSPEDGWVYSRPAYGEPPPEYLYEEPGDFQKYVEFADGQVRELLTHYPNIAGIWFDPIMGYYARPDLFNLEKTYAMIRELSPHALISFKQGATGTEDFVAPERHIDDMVERVRKSLGEESARVAAAAWEANQGKPREICDTMQPQQWGYNKADSGQQLNAAQVAEKLTAARKKGANLLLNIGPLPDGSLPKEEVDAILEAAELLKKEALCTND